MNSSRKHLLLEILRNRNTPMEAFRAAANSLAALLAEETRQFLPHATDESERNEKIVLVPILRSGVALLPEFLNSYPTATVGFVGLKRDEVTAVAELYYENIPTIGANTEVIVLDPMIATGGSACDTLKLLCDRGVAQEQIVFVSIIASTPGLERMRTEYPGVTVTTVAEDPTLDMQKFIVPGLGDFGDRYFGTDNS